MQDSQPNGAIWNARQLQSACRAGEGGFVSEPEPCTNASITPIQAAIWRECGLLLRTRRLSPAACLRLLRAGGYDGCLSIKSVGSSPDGPADAFRRSLDNIRGLVASLTS